MRDRLDLRPDRADEGGAWDGDRYQQRFDRMAAAGVDVHGEAAFIETLGPSSVLDAGCGTGRVARELDRRGIEVMGVDADASMIATALRLSPHLAWQVEDLATFDLGRHFDVVVMAGNVPLFTPEGTHQAVVAGCARHIRPGGALVAGFQLGRGYMLYEYDRHCAAAGLVLGARWATWSFAPFNPSGDADYSVSLHRFG